MWNSLEDGLLHIAIIEKHELIPEWPEANSYHLECHIHQPRCSGLLYPLTRQKLDSAQRSKSPFWRLYEILFWRESLNIRDLCRWDLMRLLPRCIRGSVPWMVSAAECQKGVIKDTLNPKRALSLRKANMNTPLLILYRTSLNYIIVFFWFSSENLWLIVVPFWFSWDSFESQKCRSGFQHLLSYDSNSILLNETIINYENALLVLNGTSMNHDNNLLVFQ